MPDVFMPRLSDTMTEGAIAQWLKAEGDTIERGDVLAEIETDKAVMDLEAYEGGVLEKILVQPGENVAIGARIAVIGDGSGSGGGEDAAAPADESAEAAEPAEQPAAEEPETAEEPAEQKPADEHAEERPAAEPKAEAETPADESEAPASSGSKIKATPLVRSLARTHGIDLGTVKGTGPGGRIVRADVEQLLGEQEQKPQAAASAPASAAPAAPATPAASAAPVATP